MMTKFATPLRTTLFLLIVASFTALFSQLHAKPQLSPVGSINTKKEITSLQIADSKIYVSTASGAVLIYNLANVNLASAKDLAALKPIQIINIPKYRDFFGELLAPKIYNTATNSKGEILIISSNSNGMRDINIYKGDHLDSVMQNINASKALWLDDSRILIGLLSHEVILYDVSAKATIYRRQIAHDSFSDMVLDSEKGILYTTGEGGAKYAVRVADGSVLEKHDHIHKDKIFQLALGGDMLIGAGQDRRLSIQNMRKNSMDFVQSSFLIYAVGVRADGALAAYMSDELGNVSVLNTANRANVALLKDMHGVPNSILFYKNFIIISTEGNEIYFFNVEGI